MQITKTLFTQSLQCQKLVYNQVKRDDKFPEDSLGIQFRKRQGTLVGELAKKLYTNGIDLAKLPDNLKLEETQKHKDRVLFEAAAKYDNLFARVDILVANEDGTHNIIEVKSDTEIKPEHIPDVSFQKYVFEKAGFKIERCFIAHANNEYVRKGELNLHEYFKIEDISKQLVPVVDSIKATQTVLSHKEEPNVKIGRHCTTPFDCPLKSECWAYLPKNNVTQLYYDKKLGFDLLDNGITSIKEIPENIELKGRGKNQRAIQIKATKGDYTHLQKEDVRNFIESLAYPIYYFDFETYAPAIPLFDNLRPWQRIPFQYSVHIEHKDGKIEHKEFLATDKNDPRPALITALKRDLGKTGSIVVFNQTFEKSVLKELARDFPHFESEVNENLLPRIVDLAAPFEQFHYYHPDQQGRYSIKVILPLFSDLNYKGMHVSNGEEAFCAYEKIVEGTKEKDNLIKNLKKYCELDTWAEVEIVKKLRNLF